MASKSFSASLTIEAIDNVSKPVRSIEQALKDAESAVKNVAKGMTGAVKPTDRFVASLAKIAKTKESISKVSDAWDLYAKSANLAANATDWTKTQAAGVRAWERQTVAALREVGAEQRKFYANQKKLESMPPPKPRPRLFSPSAAAGLGGLYGGQKAEQFVGDAIGTYRDYSDVNAIMRPVLDLSPNEQESMKAQQMKLGKESRYDSVKIAEAQKLLGERGVDKRFIQPYVEEAVNYASAMNIDLPAAIKTLEAYMFSTSKLKGVTDPAQAQAIMRKVTDYATHLSKISGLPDEEISAFFEYGGLSGHQAGLSDETVGAIATLMKRNQISGDKAGVAMRAITAKLVSPTEKGLMALAAMGINYNDFTKMPGGISGKNVGLAIQQTLGKKVSAGQIARLNALSDVTLEDGSPLIGNRGEYIAAVTEIVADSFAKNKHGQLSVTDSHHIAKTVGQLYSTSTESLDSEGLLKAIAQAHATLAQLNAFFGFQQGSRAGAALTNWDDLQAQRQKLVDTPDGFALGIATERLQSFAGALSQLEGSIKVLQVRLGDSFDDHGKGDGALTGFVNALTVAANKVIDLPDSFIRVGTEAAALGTALATLKSAGVLADVAGLSDFASGLGKATTALGRLGAAGLAAAAAWEITKAVDGDNKVGLTIDKYVPGASWLDNQASKIGLGLSYDQQFDAHMANAARDDQDRGANPARWRRRELDIDMNPLGLGPSGMAAMIGGTDREAERAHALTSLKSQAEAAKAAMDELSTTVQPRVDMTFLEQLIAKVERVKAAISSLGAVGGATPAARLGDSIRGGLTSPDIGLP